MRLKQRNPPEQNRSIDGCSLTAVNKKTPWDSKRNPAEFFIAEIFFIFVIFRVHAAFLFVSLYLITR